MKRLLLAGVLLPFTAQAQAQDRFCPNRPSLGSSTCTTEPGRVLIEASGVDRERDDTDDARTDTIRVADVQLRMGLGPDTEAQLSWTPYGRVRTRDKASGMVETARGVGDVRLGLRQNIVGNDTETLSIALEPFATLPVGAEEVGEGDWSAGLIVPVSYPLARDWTLSFTGEASAAVDEDGDGRHVAYGGIVGLGRSLGERLELVAEVAVRREDDPVEPRTETQGAVSIAWQPRDRLQLDALAVAGLNRDTPDLRLQIGAAILF